LATSQYQSGLIDYPTYLASKLTLLQSNYNLTNEQLVVVEDIVQVYQTFGLGLQNSKKTNSPAFENSVQ
jgi:outer membrane protein TolC